MPGSNGLGSIERSGSRMSAPPIHIGRIPRDRLLRVGRAVVNLLRDSNRTDETVVAEEITAQAQLRYWVRNGIFEQGEGAALFRDRAEIADVSLDELRSLPEGSFGRAFASFLDDHGLSLDALRQPAPYTDGEAESYLMRRLRQCHDVWHTLVGLGTNGYEEVLVHCFSLAQTGFPASVAIIGLGSIKHMVLEGRWSVLARYTRAAYRCGRDSAPMLAAYWERRWEHPLDAVRREFGIVPMPSR